MKNKIDKKYQKYLCDIDVSDRHNLNSPIAALDFELRSCIRHLTNIGKITVSALSHNAIINREMQGEVCRVCLRGVNMLCKSGIFICNDYLVLRHEQCINPICSDCIQKNQIFFMKHIKKGLDLWNQRKMLLTIEK